MCKCCRITHANNPNQLNPIKPKNFLVGCLGSLLNMLSVLVEIFYNPNNHVWSKRYFNPFWPNPQILLWDTRTFSLFIGNHYSFFPFYKYAPWWKRQNLHLTTSCTEETCLYLPARIRGRAKIQEVLMPSTHGNNRPAEHRLKI